MNRKKSTHTIRTSIKHHGENCPEKPGTVRYVTLPDKRLALQLTLRDEISAIE